MTFRLLPPVGPAQQTMTANGRSYSAAPGAFVDAPDQDAAILMANGWTDTALSGPTASRPTVTANGNRLSQAPGYLFLDTTLGKVIVFDGATWRDPATAASV